MAEAEGLHRRERGLAGLSGTGSESAGGSHTGRGILVLDQACIQAVPAAGKADWGTKWRWQRLPSVAVAVAAGKGPAGTETVLLQTGSLV